MPMGTYTKIKVIMLYTLNNAEYLAYMNSVLALLPPPSGGEEDRPDELSLDKEVQASGAPDIGLSKEFVNAMEKNVLALADVVDESRISQETEKAELHEKNRDNLAYIIHSGFISGYQNRYGDNLKPPTNVYHRMTA